MTTTNTATEPAVGPCPPWCTPLKPGHRWDSYEPDGRLSRGHGDDDRPSVDGLTKRDTAWASISAWEIAGEGLGAVSVSLSAEGNFTAEQARAYAAQVLDAADQLDRVTR